ncbi:MAG: hypothetical protein DI586_10905 [Micavibrio aeruginosavorus]|uniref:Uncharacterized protein n=1 Tax=Micavibrio aeruginosavorus TaxID=349221 RepID=A0A2W5H6G4_9BACT|nr:MAG: hypothetical protein DI586_10905 [Micavibrio aeruginosavorus]
MLRSFFLVGLLALPLPAFAQNAAPAPMRHMSITKTPAAKTSAPEPAAEEDKAVAPPAKESPAPKALKPQDALKKTDTLTDWPYYADLMTIDNDTALDKVIRAVDIDPGSVPPKGLFYLAKALSERKRYEEAAFYYYAGQLRATFDMARFPPYAPSETAVKLDRRTEDQIGSVPKADTVIINPHEPISILALSIGSPIARWAMADAARLDAVMEKVRLWDAATPYAYLPDYDLSHAAPFDKWPSLLTKTRNDYFTRVRQIARGLTAIRPVEPSPSFSRP